MTISQARSLLLGLSLVFAACGGDGLTLPPDGAAANIDVLWGDRQSARVGEPLPDSVVVKVTDTQDRPVAGANVVFEFTAGGATAIPDTARTSADGTTWSRLVLGTIPGQVTGIAKVPVEAGITPVETPITAMATSADANGIALVSGDVQTGPVNTQLPAPLVVAVTDQFGNPISGIGVQWSITGGGSVSSDASVTDVNGQASVTRTLGPAAGAQTAVATALGLAGSPVPFNHTATAGNAARVIVVDGNGQSAPAGTKLPKQLVVRILDDQNNPISGRAVTWLAVTGTASPETSNTDDNGEARTEWTLGPTPGANNLTAVVSGVGNGAFNATGTKLASTTTITSDGDDPSFPGPVTVAFTVTGSGGTPTGTVTITAKAGNETCSASVSEGSCSITLVGLGDRQLTATYSGDSRFTVSSDTEEHQVSPVPNSAPTAEFTFSCTNLECTFTDRSTDNGTIVNWSWDFDHPGGTSGIQSPSHTFPAAGSYNVRLTVRDDGGATDDVTHQVTVTAANTGPTATDDAYATNADVGFHAPGANGPSLIANDTDPDGEVLSTTPVSAAATANGGSVTIGNDGSFDYTPPTGFTGTDSFTYTVNDGRGGSDTGLATITIG